MPSRQIFITDRKQVGGLSRSGKVTHKSVRRTIANIKIYQKEVIRQVRREIEKAELELRAGARAAVPVGKTRGAKRGIRRRRRKSSSDTSVIQGGIVASARHSLVIEAGAPKKQRAARPFFYKQIDVAFPKFESAVVKIMADRAAWKAAARG